MVAGDWLSDPVAVEKVVKGAPGQIRQLIEWGVDFDKSPDGSFDLHREGGHSVSSGYCTMPTILVLRYRKAS